MERAIEERLPNLNFLDVDPKLDCLRRDRRFARLRNKLLSDVGRKEGAETGAGVP